eukprot:TRINITY_DN38360_c0_g1_i1.p1 TRINITY_DN38360_c0_g1~~TRINITY_DN38360_c0_g1_i1.p1  ORF type:complete len:449 (+),score=99.98 TRINITY_DN38360_c0_g1_i1:61-1347(+)
MLKRTLRALNVVVLAVLLSMTSGRRVLQRQRAAETVRALPRYSARKASGRDLVWIPKNLSRNRSRSRTLPARPRGGAADAASPAVGSAGAPVGGWQRRKNVLNIVTWNVRDLSNASDGQAHHSFVLSNLRELVQLRGADVLVLQEVQNCRLVEAALPLWSCVDTVVSPDREQRTPSVLGNVILYNRQLFEGSEENRVLWQGYAGATSWRDRYNKSLSERHAEECIWQNYNNCSRMQSDLSTVGSVRLTLRPQLWTANALQAFPGGLRLVDVHLFAGASRGGLPEAAKAARRAFQMRGLIALVDKWSSTDAAAAVASAGGQPPPSPVTVFAGDFNTRGAAEMKGVISSAWDYGVRMWCPAASGFCDAVLSQHKTHQAGYLDHVVLEYDPARPLHLRARSETFRQAGGRAARQAQVVSDHDPLLVSLAPE